jgi:DNA-binding winged helix-turn-helix (wHTH) protein
VLKLADLAMREDFSLGSLWVSPAQRLVRGPDGEVHVEPLTMQVFLVLADAKGQVVTRNFLYDECWGGVNVGDYSLNRVITMVRRIASAVGPGAFTIESIPRTGYRLVVDEHPRASARAKWRAPALIGAGAAAVIILAGSAWLYRGSPPREPSVLVSASDARSTELARGISDLAMRTGEAGQIPVRVLDAA